VIEEILPPSVASAEAFDDEADAPLYPEEEAVVARAVEARRLAFATARLCARRALGELGLPPSAIPRGDHNAPVWPEGVVGSITHCAGYRASAVAFARDLVTVGIDAEPDAPISPGVRRRIALPEEEEWLLRGAPADRGVSWDRLLFSAKESVYKAWFPLAVSGSASGTPRSRSTPRPGPSMRACWCPGRRSTGGR